MSWHPVPFVRLLLPLLLGIVLYSFHVFSFSFLSCLLAIPLFLLVIGWFQKDPSIRAVQIWGAIATSGLVFLGYALSYQQDHRYFPNHVSHSGDSLVTYIAVLGTPPERKAKSMKTILHLKSMRQDSSWQPCSGKVLAYIQLDTASILLEYGQELLFEARLNPIATPQNPAAFDAQQYYAHQNIYQQCYLPRKDWHVMAWDGQYWQQQIYTWKNSLLEILKETITTPNEYAVAAALLLGAKSSLDRPLKNAYADTGAMHVLAVSGLHVGILIAILGFLLRFLTLLGPKGKRLRALLLLVFLWLFALLTGASASVLRASTMFSFLLLGQVLGRSINIYNSLAASAFLLLCLDTNLLYQVGFQLSYLALIGIVYLHPKIYALWKTNTRWKDWLWQGIAVSIAAQIATTPLSLYYFHQFPVFFWLSGLVVTALAGVLLAVGLALLLLSQVPILGVLIAKLFESLLFVMNTLIFGIQQLPGAVWEGFWLETWQLWLAYFILISIIICLLQRRLPWGIAALTGIAIFLSFEVWQQGEQRQQAQLCIYNSRKSSAWSVLDGKTSFTWIDSTLLLGNQLEYLQQNYLYAQGITNQQKFTLKTTYRGNFGEYINGKGIFFGTRLALYGAEEVYLESGTPLSVDYVLLHGNPRLYDLERIALLYDYQTLVFDGSSNRWNRQRWAADCDRLGIPYVDVVETGALVVDLR
ncbi:MAG: ComEC/Rec2 family competence protein [Aureispira sp.]